MTPDEVLRLATRGDEDAFRDLVAPLRVQLHAHCYRMLGSAADADDALQEALLRAWRGLPDFEGRSSVRSWLFRIATNVCLNAIHRAPPRALPLDVVSTPRTGESSVHTMDAWITPYPDSALATVAHHPEVRYEQREATELAMVAALQHLPGNERAALLLREVIGFSAREVAELMNASVPAVNSALQRARRLVADRVPGPSQQARQRSLGDRGVRELVEAYVSAFEKRDVDALVALLTDDATWSMPPQAELYSGRGEITAFLSEGPFQSKWRHLPTSANGQPAVGCYAWNDRAGAYVASVLDVLTLSETGISAVTAFVDPGVFARFELPRQLVSSGR